MCTPETVTEFRGKLIAFEGIDFAGKSSVVQMMAELLEDCQRQVTICGELRSPLTCLIRDVLNNNGTPFLKTYLFAADRAWEYENNCVPALRNGDLVLWDRYVDSAIVYRAVELAKSPSLIGIEFVRAINSPFVKPDMTIYIDIDEATILQREQSSGRQEPYNSQFLAEARTQYLELTSGTGYITIDGRRPILDVAGDVATAIRSHFKELFNEGIDK